MSNGTSIISSPAESSEKSSSMFDLVIIGSGSAAFAAALKAAEQDSKVAVLEKGTIGGTCVNVGCVPSKNLLRAGELRYYDTNRDFPGIRPGRTILEFRKLVAFPLGGPVGLK